MTESNKGNAPISETDDPFLNVDLIEVNQLINYATSLLDEIIVPGLTSPRADSPEEDAMSQAQSFLRLMREREPPGDDDVVFVEERPGNAPPANARTIAIVDLSNSNSQDEQTSPNTRKRRRRTAEVLGAAQGRRSNISGIPAKTRRCEPKTEPGTIVLDDSVVSEAGGSSPTEAVPDLSCSICMTNVLKRQPTSTSCGHIFCKNCILRAIRLTKKCPLCNSNLKPSQVHRIYF